MAPHIPTIPAGNAVVNQAPIGTPVTPRPTLPFGFRALNASTTTTAQTTTQIVPGSSIPIQQPGGTGLGGPNPIGNTGQSLASSFQIPGTLPQTGGHPPSGGQIHSEGTLMLGGILPPEDKFHSGGTLMLGGNLKSFSRSPPSTTRTKCVCRTQSVERPFSRKSTCLHGDKMSQTPQQPPYGQMPNPTYNPQNPSGYPPLTHASQNTSNPVYLGQNQPHMRGPTSYNYPHNPVMGPTGVPLPHQHYPQVNRQLCPSSHTSNYPFDMRRVLNY
jgi:hypothetical protein